jgi:hypothetical protein
MVNDIGIHMIVAQIAFYCEHLMSGTFSTASMSRMTRREAVGVDAAVSGHVPEIASSKDASHDVRQQR